MHLVIAALLAVSFQQGVGGYQGCSDAWLDEASPDANHGGTGDVQTAGAPGAKQFGVIRWDLSGVPRGSLVRSATISLYITRPTNLPNRWEWYALTRAWSEQTVTWRSPWQTPGGDRAPAPAATMQPLSVGPFDVTLDPALVQRWIDDPSTNFGLWVGQPATLDDLYFRASDTPQVPLRPALNIDLGPVVDGGSTQSDAGATPADGGSMQADAGAAPADGGTPGLDAGTPEPNLTQGLESPNYLSVGCSSAPSWAPLLLGLWATVTVASSRRCVRVRAPPRR